MIPLVHDSEPEELTNFIEENQNLEVEDFDSLEFQPIKALIKERLHELQGKQCVYCERFFADLSKYQVEHIKPKSGGNAHPDLCFEYTNYAASCIQNVAKAKRTCGQNKKDNLLAIEPTNPICNDLYILNTEGEIHPISSSTRREKHDRKSTLDMLGLNKPHLVLLRKKRIKAVIAISKLNPQATRKFIESGDFRFILCKLTE